MSQVEFWRSNVHVFLFVLVKLSYQCDFFSGRGVKCMGRGHVWGWSYQNDFLKKTKIGWASHTPFSCQLAPYYLLYASIRKANDPARKIMSTHMCQKNIINPSCFLRSKKTFSSQSPCGLRSKNPTKAKAIECGWWSVVVSPDSIFPGNTLYKGSCGGVFMPGWGSANFWGCLNHVKIWGSQ